MKDYKGEMIMSDSIEIIEGGSVIHHGKQNDRVYLMSLKGDAWFTLNEIEKLANSNRYSKIFCKIPKSVAPIFIANGYMLEACIPKFYNKLEDVFFVSKFLNSDRLLNIEKAQLLSFSKLLQNKPARKINPLAEGYKARRLDETDVKQITQIYREVFVSYPFPIHNQDYILQTMEENIQYYGVEKDGKLVALSSAEIDLKGENAEMTDFATLLAHGGNNLSCLLLDVMEDAMKIQDITTLYTIARLNSIPMNKTFLKSGYEYSGTLMKNTDISGQIESMNIYYKHI